jgi:hypothetical protein
MSQDAGTMEPLDPPFEQFVPRTEPEAIFLRTLLQSNGLGLDLWWSDDPWVSVTLTQIRGNVAVDDVRLDFDGTSIRGGYDPSGLQDLYTPIEATVVNLDPPDGIVLSGPPDQLAKAAMEWFEEVAAKWRDGRRHRVLGSGR